VVGRDGIERIQYAPRHYFKPFHNRTQRFACIVAHRRAGKTVACIHDLQRAAIRNALARPRYAYMAPTYSQAKSAAFDYLIEAAAPIFPYGAEVNKSELRVDYPNGAQVRLFGADNYNALRGLRLDGVVLDEFADFDPRAWPAVIRPALSDRRGNATFIGTPRGHNSFYDLWTDAQGDPDWFTASLKASELVPLNDKDPRAKERFLLTSDELSKARKDMSEELYNQEYECDFEAAIVGAYYGKYMADAAAAGRICGVPHDPAHQVWTAWDIGGDRDATAIWFVQLIGKEIRVIDYFEGVGSDSAPYAKLVLEKNYNYAQHFLPHDAGPNRIGIDKSYTDFLSGHGLRNVTVLPPGVREHGINLTRQMLARCWFDASHCHQGIEALKMYRAKYDDKTKTLSAQPIHDWASHGADAFRYLAVALDKHVTSSSFNRKIVYPKFGIA
jgi:phage terminase large subunit